MIFLVIAVGPFYSDPRPQGRVVAAADTMCGVGCDGQWCGELQDAHEVAATSAGLPSPESGEQDF